jgi:outer membrane protein assembly factor BamB
MKNSISKTMSTMISLLLMLTIAITSVALPAANAQPASRMKTYAYIGAVPNPVGVGQEVLLHAGITDHLELQPDGWEGLSIKITRPDGTTETISDIRTDSTGGTGRMYVPSMEGNYTVQTIFPEQVCVNGVFGFFGMTIPPGTVMEASESKILTLVVQQESLKYYPGFPLPTEYWTRPFDAQHREWAQIAGSWLETPVNRYVPYNDAPETAHILWTTQLTTGGTVGGALDNSQELTEQSFDMGDAYEGKFGAGIFGGGNPVIIAGKLYYEKYAGNDVYKETACLDLHTGEELWSRPLLDNQTFTRGQLLYWDTYDYHGVYDYLIAQVGGGFFDPRPPTWHFFDPWTGDWVYALYDLPSGSMIRGPKGEFLIYTVDTQDGWMTMWNSTNIPELYASSIAGSMQWGQWHPMGKTVNATGPAGVRKGSGFFPPPWIAPTTPLDLAGYMWNKTIPTGLAGSVIRVLDDRIIGGSISDQGVSLWGLSRKPGQEGMLLFDKTWNPPASFTNGNLTIETAAVSSNGVGGVLTIWSKEERTRYGFSTETGEYLWATDDPEYYLQIYVSTSTAIVDNKLYSTGASGVTYCYSTETGDLLWEYHAVDPYSEILWANDWWTSILFIADGKIYLGHEEHSPIDPRPRGAPFICLNATTGEEIWRIDGAFRQTHWGGHALIGDSIIATMDSYDQRVYGIGKGPSATTVTGPEIVQPLGTPILIKGTVTDISPGTEDYALTTRFPQGVPAVSDDSMSEWMLYVYKQFPRPADATGVEVTLSVLDPNNNVYDVGTATTDSSGFFKLMFTPDVPGEYTVIASFVGSGAYYGSFAETAIGVTEAPLPPLPEEPLVLPPTESYITVATIAIIIAIAIVGLLILRKR